MKMAGKLGAPRIGGCLFRWPVKALGVVSALALAFTAAAAIAESPQSSQSQPPAQMRPAPAALSDQDKTFIESAARSGMMQVALGKLAAEHAQSPRLRPMSHRTRTAKAMPHRMVPMKKCSAQPGCGASNSQSVHGS